MAISVNWGTRVVTIPQSYLTFVSGVDWTLDLDKLRLDLKGEEAGELGIIFPDTHSHNTEIVLAGITYARSIEMINSFTITFEPGAYRVIMEGANSNVQDVTNYNITQTASQNSAGLIVVATGGGGGSCDTVDEGLATGTPTNLSIPTDMTGFADDFYNQYLLFVEDGTNTGTRIVSKYTGASGTFSLVSPLPFTPGAGATVKVLVHRASTAKMFL